jgi:hypothetical protein
MVDECTGFDDAYWTLPKIGRAIERLWPAIRRVYSADTKNHGNKKYYSVSQISDMLGVIASNSETPLENNFIDSLKKEPLTTNIISEMEVSELPPPDEGRGWDGL